MSVNNSFGFPQALSALGSRLQKLFFRFFGILSWRKQKEIKSRNQNFKAAPTWIISSGQIQSKLRALPGFKC